MPKPVCVPCQRFFRPAKNGFVLIEAMPQEEHALPGTEQPDAWAPYKLWNGDKWKCEGCGAEIVVGFGKAPLSEHYLPNWDQMVAYYNPQLTVNDC